MLSILIPTYNYNITQLVTSLHNLCLDSNNPFEILIFDDGSNSPINIENEKLNKLEHVTFKALNNNVGLSNNRNNLAKASQYNYLLFIDADMVVYNNNYVNNYLDFILKNKSVVYGGIDYDKDKPEKNYLLRWLYGNKNESKKVLEREKHQYRSILCSNLLIKKAVFNTIKFETTLDSYGYEDTVFCYNLMKNQIDVSHIDNVLLHNDKTSNTSFISKTKSALNNLGYLINNDLIDPSFVRLSKVHGTLKKYRLNFIFAGIYKIFGRLIERNLNSKYSSLNLYNLYKLGYYCHLNLKQK